MIDWTVLPKCGRCGKETSWSLVVAMHTEKGPICVECWYVPEPWHRRLWARVRAWLTGQERSDG